MKPIDEPAEPNPSRTLDDAQSRERDGYVDAWVVVAKLEAKLEAAKRMAREADSGSRPQ